MENDKSNTSNSKYNLRREEDWLRYLPQELFWDILELSEPAPCEILRLQLLSKYWSGIFKGKNVWRLMCRLYDIPLLPDKDDAANYFELFLSRYVVHFINKQNYERCCQRKLYGFGPIGLVDDKADFPGQPRVQFTRIWRINPMLDMPAKALDRRLAVYERWFKDQRVHPNLTAQKLVQLPEERFIAFFEPTDDYLLRLLFKKPELVNETNISDIIKQMMLAFDWLIYRQIYNHHLNLENFRVNILPGNKLQVKFHSAVFNFSSRMTLNTFAPPEVVGGQPCTANSYSWMIGWVTLMLLTGHDVFNKEGLVHLTFEAIIAGNFEFEDSWASHVTPMARDFVSKLMKKEQSERMSIKQALNHEWIRSPNKSVEPLSRAIEKLKYKYEHHYEVND